MNNKHDIRLLADMLKHMSHGNSLDAHDRANLQDIRERHGLDEDDSMIDGHEAQAQWETQHGLTASDIDGIDPNHPFGPNASFANY